MITTLDRLEASDTARAVCKALEREIALTQPALDYYARLDDNMGGKYAAGGYVLTDGGRFITRGDHGQQMKLSLAEEGLRHISRYTTQKEAETAAERWSRWFPDAPAVSWMGHRDAIEAHARKLTARLVIEKRVAAEDPWFDGSGAAQDFDANGGL